MEEVYGWIRNLTGFFLFMSVIDNLLPGKKYGKYVRFFSGMVLILLVLQPLTGSLRVEDKIAQYYESFVFRYQADDLKQEILGVETQRLAQVIEQYEHAVEQDVSQMAVDTGFAVEDCRVDIEGDEGAERFGMVTDIRLRVSFGERQYYEEAYRDEASYDVPRGETSPEGTSRTGLAKVRIEPVVVETETGRASEAGPGGNAEAATRARAAAVPGTAQDTVDAANPEEDTEVSASVHAATGKLRRKIASYYNLEEEYVEIQVVKGQG